MKRTLKAIFSIMCVIALSFMFVECKMEISCTHQWKEATCTTPKTCEKCGAIEGEVLSHQWQNATCSTPQKCILCGKTEGNALGHEWREASCYAPKTCVLCGETEGNVLEHIWREASCYAPKTCVLCGDTEGKALEHNWNKATCLIPKTCTLCGATEGKALGHDWREATCISHKTCARCGTIFDNNYGAHNYVNGKCIFCGKNVLEITCSQSTPIYITSYNGASLDYLTINDLNISTSGNSVTISGTYTVISLGSPQFGGGWVSARIEFIDSNGTTKSSQMLFQDYCTSRGTYSFRFTDSGYSGNYTIIIKDA